MNNSLDFKSLPNHIQIALQDIIRTPPKKTDYKNRIISEAIQLAYGDHDTADIKMLGKILAELRLGLNVFKPYQARRKVSVFGSARTNNEDPRYLQTRACSKALSDAGFMIITGGGGGMMQAANEGAGEAESFAINIDLPMEQHKPTPSCEEVRATLTVNIFSPANCSFSKRVMPLY